RDLAVHAAPEAGVLDSDGLCEVLFPVSRNQPGGGASRDPARRCIMAKLLVTGGCGFIGSNFIHYLLETDPTAPVINLHALTYAGNRANLEAVASNQRYSFVHGSVTDRELVRGILREGVHSVLHFAAESHVDRSIHDATPFVSTNILGTQILLDASREFGVQ